MSYIAVQPDLYLASHISYGGKTKQAQNTKKVQARDAVDRKPSSKKAQNAKRNST